MLFSSMYVICDEYHMFQCHVDQSKYKIVFDAESFDDTKILYLTPYTGFGNIEFVFSPNAIVQQS
jgi:hypothetical protein